MTTYTPGPWHVTTCADVWVEHSQPTEPEDAGFCGIAQCGDIDWPNSAARQREWEANARLIAAAPAMLAALEAVLRHCVTTGGMPDRNKGRTESQQAALDAANAALALAEGGKP